MNMDTNFQIQGIKSQIDNMKFQIENIETQYNNMMNLMMLGQIGDQLLALSMQMLNTGIQTFNIGKNLTFNIDKYFNQLKTITDQINNLINIHNIEKQQQMMQQQIMAQQQQMMMQQQMMAQQEIMHNQNQQQQVKEWRKVNIQFRLYDGTMRNIIMNTNSTIKEIYDRIIKEVCNNENKYIYISFKGKYLKRDDNRKIKEYFADYKGFQTLPELTVLYNI